MTTTLVFSVYDGGFWNLCSKAKTIWCFTRNLVAAIAFDSVTLLCNNKEVSVNQWTLASSPFTIGSFYNVERVVCSD